MKWFLRILLLIGAAYVLYWIVLIVVVFSPVQPSRYLNSLSRDPATYSGVATIAPAALVTHAYAYERNRYVDALPGATPKPNVADAAGHVPAFKLGSDIFIVTYKWINCSSGLAISEDRDFQAKIERADDVFRVRHLRDNIYQWDLDLE